MGLSVGQDGRMISAGDADPNRRPEPTLVVYPAAGRTRAVVLVLHGGKAASRSRVRPWHLSVARMRPFERAVVSLAASADGGGETGQRATGEGVIGGRAAGVAVWALRYRVRGWNGAAADPVRDARWALSEVRRRHGEIGVVLLGHSMGGRAALHVAGDPLVAGVVALAPWVEAADPVPATRAPVTIVHGTADRWTSPHASAAWADRAITAGISVTYVTLRGVGHFMLRRAGTWRRHALDAVADALAGTGAGDRPDDHPPG